MSDPSLGPKRQKALEEYAKTKDNWLEEIWDGSYLSYRGPLPVAMNYYLQLSIPPASRSNSVLLAAKLLESTVRFRNQVVSEELPVDENAGCMSQFGRLFGHARVAKEGVDGMVCYEVEPEGLPTRHFATEYVVPVDGRRHAVVLCGGEAFRVELTGESGELRGDVRAQLEGIWKEVGGQRSGTDVAAVTALEREEVAVARRVVGEEDDWKAVDEAMVVLCLDTNCGAPFGGRTAQSFIHGYRGGDRWFDKHLLIVQPDGTCGVLMEHAQGDGTPVLEWLSAMVRDLENGVEEGKEGSTQSVDRLFGSVQSTSQEAQRLIQRGRDQIEEFWRTLRVVEDRTWGSDAIKKAGMAPDAGFQTILQLAHLRAHGYSVPTYESASTRSFLHGRTETIRSNTILSQRAASFLRSPPSSPEQASAALSALRRSAQNHQQLSREATAGRGIDRHLTGLRFAESALLATEPHPFLHHPALLETSRWRLSTSNCGNPHTQLFGFGPVVQDGYGLGYQIHKDHTAMSIADFQNNPTDPQLLADTIRSVTHDIQKCLLLEN